MDWVKDLDGEASRTLVFVETKEGTESLDEFLYREGCSVTSIHGDRTQREREEALRRYLLYEFEIIVCTMFFFKDSNADKLRLLLLQRLLQEVWIFPM